MHWTLKTTILLVFAGAFTFTANAQKKYEPKFKKKRSSIERVFPSETVFKPGGWQFGAGITGMLNFTETQHSIPESDNNLTTEGGLFPFAAFEIGRFYNFKPTFTFSYLNYGIAYKGWGASERFTFNGNDQSHTNLSHYASAYFDINSTVPVSKMHFIQNTIGVSADYGFPGAGNNYPANISAAQMPRFNAGVNYKLGLGIKPDTDIIFVPYIQVNVFNIYPQQTDFYRYDVFNTSYVPFIIGLRVMHFNLAEDSCPKVDGKQLTP